MKFWRLLMLFLILIAVGLLSAAAIFGWSPTQAFHGTRPSFLRPPFEAAHFQSPAPVALLCTLFTLYICGAIELFLFPRRVGYMTRALGHSRWDVLRIGLIGFLAVAILIVVTLSSAFAMGTFPLTVILTIVLFLTSLYGMIAVAYGIGHSLLVRAGWPDLSPLTALLIGEVLLFSLINLPWVGAFVILVIISLGLGVAIATRYGSGRPWSLVPLIEEGNE